MEKIVENNGRSLAIATWKEVREEVLAVNEELGLIIDEIDPGDEYKLIQAEYLYGDPIICDSVLQLPDKENNLVSIRHNSVNTKIREELYYSDMPLSLMLDKDSEVFVRAGTRIIPLNLFHRGSMIGVYETMDFMTGREQSNPIWNFTAGSCSIFMLPKITDKLCLKRLRNQYRIPTTIQVKQLSDHWELFKIIAQNESFEQSWRNKVLLFGFKWIKNNHTSPAWMKFKHHILREVWRQAQFTIEKVKFSFGWEKFAEAIALRRLQPSNYILDQVKHILSIVAGNFPAFVPIDDSQEAAPTQALQKAFVDVYSLRHHLPTIMHARSFESGAAISPVYYSLSFPTVLEGSPLKKISSTIMSDTRETKLLIETIKQYSDRELDKQVNDIINKINIDYFHAEADMHNEIRISTEIPKEDSRFLQDKKKFPNLDFCPTSPFFKGCIRISID